VVKRKQKKEKSTKYYMFRVLTVILAIFLLLIIVNLFFMIFDIALSQPRTFIVNGRKTIWAGSIYGKDYLDGTAQFKYCYSSNERGYFDKDNCVSHSVNIDFFRSPALNYTKPENVFRIIVLGDSFTFGEGVLRKDTFVERLEWLLKNEDFDSEFIEVLNLGKAGADTKKAHQTYREYGENLDPDLVILQWNTNDFPVSSISQAHLKLINGNYVSAFDPPEMLKWSAVGRYLWHLVKTKKVSDEIIKVTNQELDTGMSNFYDILVLQEDIIKDGSDFILLVFPELIQLQDYPYSNVINALIDFCDVNDIEYTNSLDILDTYEDKELWVHKSDHHPNEIAHMEVSKLLYDYIKEKYKK